MTKKLLISLIIMTIFSYPVLSAQLSNIDKMEDSILGATYPKDKIEKRVQRLEKAVYGKEKTGSTDSRLAKLSKDTNSDVMGEEISPVRDTFAENDEVVKSDGTENYPIINEIEQKLFNKSTPERSLHKRLVEIEKKMFNKTYDTDDYYTRMERIKSEYYAQNPPIAQTNNNDDDNSLVTTEDNSDTTGNYKSFYASPQANDYMFNQQPYSNINEQDEYDLTALEEKILKNTYKNQSMNERLSRLENKLFETDFFYDDDKIRIDRIESAAKAKKSAKKYDNNKFYSKLNTALQIGTMLLMVLAFIL